MILVSIIVPIYNVEKYLSRCIDSLINQTLKNLEIILVNDGSTDNSGKICDQYASIDNRIKVIHKQNGGLSHSRNVGIDISIGKYILFVDSDDFIHPKMIETLYDNIVINNGDIAICDFKRVYEDNNIIFKGYQKLQYVKVYNNIEALGELYSKNVINFVVAWNKLYNKDLFIGLRYKENKIHEDEFIIHELLYKSNKVIYIPIPLYYYFQRESSIMKSRFSIRRLDGLDAYRERIRFFKDKKEKDLLEKAVFTYSREFFVYYYKLKREVNCSNIYLKKIKKDYVLLLKYIIKNSYYTKKEKLVIIIFCINPKIYEIYKKLKGGGNNNARGNLDNYNQT